MLNNRQQEKIKMSEDAIARNPNLDLAQLRFLLSVGSPEVQRDAKEKLLSAIKEKAMTPFYDQLVAEFSWPLDAALRSEISEVNKKEIARLDTVLADAQENLGETEVREALLAKAEYLTQIGEKENALSAFRAVYDKTASVGYRLDIVFSQIRIGFFNNDNDLIGRNIEKAKTLIDEGGDWDRRNRLKVYEGVYLLSIRDFKGAIGLFTDSISTFTSTELLDYKDFVKYTVLAAAISLDRPDIKKKIIQSPDILEVISAMPTYENYINALYNCQYAEFFGTLAEIEIDLKSDRLLQGHVRFYVREMRIVAYAQLLESYRSLTLESMAESFGVSVTFIDQDLSRFIAAGRLRCVIDKVGGIVETNRPDAKNAQYQNAIKSGDVLLNRIQKLSRVINV